MCIRDSLYPMLRTLLSSAEPPDLNAQRWELFRSRLRELVLERLNPRRGGVQRLLDPEQGPALSRELVGFAFVVELADLGGQSKLPAGVPVDSLIVY